MANECFFQMRIYAPKNNAKEFIEEMGELYRIYDIWTDPHTSDDKYAEAEGNCAWSIVSSMRDGYDPSLEELTRRHHICLEAWSLEEGMAFYEHCILEDGYIKIDDCFNMKMYDPSNFNNVDEFNKYYNVECDDYVFDEAKQEGYEIVEERIGDGHEFTWEDLRTSPHYMFFLTPTSDRNIDNVDNIKITDLF